MDIIQADLPAASATATLTKDYADMSMLTQGLERPLAGWNAAADLDGAQGTAQARRAQALALLSMGSVLAALIALKTAIYVWHIHA